MLIFKDKLWIKLIIQVYLWKTEVIYFNFLFFFFIEIGSILRCEIPFEMNSLSSDCCYVSILSSQIIYILLTS